MYKAQKKTPSCSLEARLLQSTTPWPHDGGRKAGTETASVNKHIPCLVKGAKSVNKTGKIICGLTGKLQIKF